MGINIVHLLLYFFVALWPNAGHGLLIHQVSRSHTTTHHSRQDSSGRMIRPSQKPLPDNTQHSQETEPRRDSNPQFQQKRGRRPTRQTARPWDRHLVLSGQCNEMVQLHLSFLQGQNQVEMNQSEINSANKLINVGHAILNFHKISFSGFGDGRFHLLLQWQVHVYKSSNK